MEACVTHVASPLRSETETEFMVLKQQLVIHFVAMTTSKLVDQFLMHKNVQYYIHWV